MGYTVRMGYTVGKNNNIEEPPNKGQVGNNEIIAPYMRTAPLITTYCVRNRAIPLYRLNIQ